MITPLTVGFRLKVTDNQGATSTVNLQFPIYGTPSPGGATLVKAQAGVRQNTLTWTAVPDQNNVYSSSFNVYWSTTPGVTPATGNVVTNVVSPFVHTGLTPGVTYYYVVTGVGAGGQESPPSLEVNAKALDSAWDVPVGFGPNLRATGIKIALDGSGNSMAVWANCCSPQGIFANRFDPNSGWGTPQMISTNPNGSVPQVASDSVGNSIAVWLDSDGTRTNVWTNRFVAGTGWGAAQVIGMSNGGAASVPQIVMDASGNAWTVWLQNDGTRSQRLRNRYTSGSGWGTPVLLENDSTNNAAELVLAGNANGHVMALWKQNGLQVARYSGSGWEAPQNIGATFNGYGAAIAMDATGNAIAAWEQDVSGAGRRIFTKMYTMGAGWDTAAAQLESYTAGNSYAVNAAMSLNGNAIVSWYHYNNGYVMHANRYRPGTGWSGAESLGEPGIWSSVVVDDNGNALVAWYWNYSYWSKRYLANQNWGPLEIVGDLASEERLSMALGLNGIVSAAWGYDNVELIRTTLASATANNTPPTAAPGANQAVDEYATVTLDGSASTDSQGAIIGYLWRQTTGPVITLSNATAASAGFTAPEVSSDTVFSFSLTVADYHGVTSTATTNITVRNVNAAPLANAGTDRPVGDDTTVYLDGTASTDSDGTIVSYKWTQKDGIPVILFNSTSATANFVSPLVSNSTPLVFELKVTDNAGGVSTDTVTLTVTHNKAPTANAGTDQAVNENTNVMLPGSGSDTDGTIASYAWTQTAGPAVTLNNANTSTANFTAPMISASTVLTFRLTVTDNLGATGSDTVNVTVNNVNQPPTANAGTDQAVDEGAAVSLPGSGNDPDGTIASYAWTQTAGPAVTLTGANTANAGFTAPAVTADTVLTFRLTVTDNNSATGTDDVNVTVRNVVVVSPQVASVTTSTFGTNTTAHAVTMPSSVSAGDLLLMLVTSDGSANQTTPSGWTALFLNQRSGTAVTFSAFTKVATGTEGGTTVNVATSATEQAAAQVYRITSWYGNLSGVVTSASATGTNASPNPASLTPSWGAGNTLWIATHAADHNSTRSTTAYPANYTNGLHTQSNTGSSAVHVSSARRAQNAATEDPGTFTMSASDDWVARTIAVRAAPNQAPSADAGPDQAVMEGAAVTLNGSGSDADGSVVSYAWTQTAGPTVTLTGANTASAGFTAPAVTADTALTFQLTVTDNLSATASDSVTVTVVNTGLLGVQPGYPQMSINQGGTATQYNAGTQLFQVDAALIEFKFQQSDTPYVTFGTSALRFLVDSVCRVVGGDTGHDLIVTGDVYDPNTFELVLSGTLLTGEAVAVGEQSVTGNTAAFDFRFTVTGGLLVTQGHWPVGQDIGVVLSSTNSNFPGHCGANFSGGANGFLGPLAPPPNQPPTANAGTDQAVDEGAAVSLPGSGNDPDGTIASYAWTQTAGPAVTLTGANTANAGFTAPAVTADTVLTFRLTVTDNNSATGTDDVNVTVRNVVVVSPQVASVTTSTFGTNTTAHAVTMPSSVSAGDLLLMLVTSDGSANQTTPSGWTALFLNQRSGTAVTFSAFTKVATGTEGGTTVNVATSATEQAAAQVYRITSWYGNLSGVVTSASATGTNASPNPASLTPSWGAGNTLWIATHAADHNSTRSTTAYPANYTNGLHTQSNTGSSAVHVSSARRAQNAATEDPGTFTMSASDDWVARTIAVRAAP